MQITSNYVQGMRATDGETMDVVEMVLVGKVNKEIVGLINHCGGKAVGLSGRDGDLVQASKMTIHSKPDDETRPPELIDLGRVGEVTHVNTDILETLDAEDFIPVIAPVGVGDDGQAGIGCNVTARLCQWQTGNVAKNTVQNPSMGHYRNFRAEFPGE